MDILFFKGYNCAQSTKQEPIFKEFEETLLDDMDTYTYTVATERESLVNSEFAKELGVTSTPTIIFIPEDGVQYKITGFHTLSEIEKIFSIVS